MEKAHCEDDYPLQKLSSTEVKSSTEKNRHKKVEGSDTLTPEHKQHEPGASIKMPLKATISANSPNKNRHCQFEQVLEDKIIPIMETVIALDKSEFLSF